MVESVQVGKLKAYICRDEGSCENYETVVFASGVGAAKVLALLSDAFEGADYTDIRVRRCKALDGCYRGHAEMNWYDTLDRIDLCDKAGFRCAEPDRDDCTKCCAADYCDDYQDYLTDLEYEREWEAEHGTD